MCKVCIKETNKILYDWLEQEWKISNHKKYKKYFNEWVENITPGQVKGFNKMRTADYIQH
jgi:hypothetical protein